MKPLSKIIEDINAVSRRQMNALLEERNIVHVEVVSPLVRFAHCNRPALLVKTFVSRESDDTIHPGVRWITCQCCGYANQETHYTDTELNPPIGFRHNLPFLTKLKAFWVGSFISGDPRAY